MTKKMEEAYELVAVDDETTFIGGRGSGSIVS